MVLQNGSALGWRWPEGSLRVRDRARSGGDFTNAWEREKSLHQNDNMDMEALGTGLLILRSRMWVRGAGRT